MILKRSHQNSGFEAGKHYTGKVGDGTRHRQESRAVWEFLERALDAEVCLTILPSVVTGPELADLPFAGYSGFCDQRELSLPTSGTTGTPKQVSRDLTKAMGVLRRPEPDSVWLLAYSPYRWAGVSVMIHALLSGARVAVSKIVTPDELLRTALDDGATHVSFTPSMFRQLQLGVGTEALKSLDFRQVTFGGESASQAVLDSAASLWPNSRVSHVYASTEFGDICAVSDGLEGIPHEKFSHPKFSFDTGGELQIDKKGTGDLWRLENRRWLFLGRKEEQINVGGVKISPLEIERAAMSIDGVHAARAFGAPSPLLGQVVALDFIGHLEERELRRRLGGLLPRFAMPAVIRRVQCLPVTSAVKVDRIHG